MDAGKQTHQNAKDGLGVFACPHCQQAVGFLYPVDPEVGEDLMMAAMDLEDLDASYEPSEDSSDLPQGEESLEEKINFLRKSVCGFDVEAGDQDGIGAGLLFNRLERSCADISELAEWAKRKREEKVK